MKGNWVVCLNVIWNRSASDKSFSGYCRSIQMERALEVFGFAKMKDIQINANTHYDILCTSSQVNFTR